MLGGHSGLGTHGSLVSLHRLWDLGCGCSRLKGTFSDRLPPSQGIHCSVTVLGGGIHLCPRAAAWGRAGERKGSPSLPLFRFSFSPSLPLGISRSCSLFGVSLSLCLSPLSLYNSPTDPKKGKLGARPRSHKARGPVLWLPGPHWAESEAQVRP